MITRRSQVLDVEGNAVADPQEAGHPPLILLFSLFQHYFSLFFLYVWFVFFYCFVRCFLLSKCNLDAHIILLKENRRKYLKRRRSRSPDLSVLLGGETLYYNIYCKHII